MEDKIEKLVDVLRNMQLREWNQIKNEVDIAYRNVEYKKVPNSELGNLKENLIHELKL